MKILVVGLGLIGGSFCKAISENTNHLCLGMDTDPETIQEARKEHAIAKEATIQDLQEADLTLICLHPKKTIQFILNHCDNFKPGSIVSDVCGIKQAVYQAVKKPLTERQIHYIGTHPMAGRAFSGFKYAKRTLFHGASFIITHTEKHLSAQETVVQQLAYDLGFKRVVFSTPEEHDHIIAYTSQLAHVVSNAYVKSPTLQKRVGFSAGSFLDLTRVAQLNESMWTELFLMNKDPLLYEIDIILKNLQRYRTAIAANDKPTLEKLLKEGRILKEESLKAALQGGMSNG